MVFIAGYVEATESRPEDSNQASAQKLLGSANAVNGFTGTIQSGTATVLNSDQKYLMHSRTAAEGNVAKMQKRAKLLAVG